MQSLRGFFMLLFAVVAAVVLWDGPAGAIRWEFDDGTTQGWTAKEAGVWGGIRELHLFPGEVDEGVWRVAVDPEVVKGSYKGQNVEVISSAIGYDSSLFDRVRIRFRTVHDRPTVGTFSMEWTNEHNALSSGWDPEDPRSGSRFHSHVQRVVYTTEWQEVVLSLAGQDEDETIWEGLLKDIQLSFVFDTEPTQSASGVVAWFEIDWIELTGVEELLQGELAPPYIEYFGFEGDGVFAPPVFYPIAPGIGGRGESDAREGVLTDLDGDGALDLFAVWMSPHEGDDQPGDQAGWLMALNDGHGVLELKRIEEVAVTGQSITDSETGGMTVSLVSLEVLGADLTGDGRDEVAMYISNAGSAVEVWSIGAELQVEVLMQIESRWLGDVADWDGDGKAELFVGTSSREEGSTLEVWGVEQGVWTVETAAAAERHVLNQVGDFTGDGTLNVLWAPIFGRASTWIVGALGDEVLLGETFEFAEGKRPLWSDLLGVGDFDGDGEVDLLTGFIRDLIEGRKGLALQSKSGGGVEAAVLYDDRLFVRSPVLVDDLNADGIDDWVFIGGDRASGFGVFVEWGGSISPTQDGERYRLEGSGTRVLSGDMDGDGDEDLVVLDPILGGVHVLKSSLASTATAVLTSADARPAQYRLGDSYPNPFNPAVVLPLDLAKDAATVSLRVHDVLGRRVRQVWDGPLRAGQHHFTWDGRDEAGKAVAAGVYVYRVEVEGRVEAKKTTKLP